MKNDKEKKMDATVKIDDKQFKVKIAEYLDSADGRKQLKKAVKEAYYESAYSGAGTVLQVMAPAEVRWYQDPEYGTIRRYDGENTPLVFTREDPDGIKTYVDEAMCKREDRRLTYEEAQKVISEWRCLKQSAVASNPFLVTTANNNLKSDAPSWYMDEDDGYIWEFPACTGYMKSGRTVQSVFYSAEQAENDGQTRLTQDEFELIRSSYGTFSTLSGRWYFDRKSGALRRYGVGLCDLEYTSEDPAGFSVTIAELQCNSYGHIMVPADAATKVVARWYNARYGCNLKAAPKPLVSGFERGASGYPVLDEVNYALCQNGEVYEWKSVGHAWKSLIGIVAAGSYCYPHFWERANPGDPRNVIYISKSLMGPWYPYDTYSSSDRVFYFRAENGLPNVPEGWMFRLTPQSPSRTVDRSRPVQIDTKTAQFSADGRIWVPYTRVPV